MKKNVYKMFYFLSTLIVFVFCFSYMPVYASLEEDSIIKTSKTITNLNIREFPTIDSLVVSVIPKNASINILAMEDDWAWIQYNNSLGFVNIGFLENMSSKPTKLTNNNNTVTEKSNIQNISSKSELSKKVELVDWSMAKTIVEIGKDIEVYDIYTGKTYKIRSFSNGSHSDVEPITKQDTQIMYETFEKKWSWEVRPVWISINGRTLASSINGMPHAKGTNPNNGMDGQICLHFKASKTHNGNASYTAEHQKYLLEAYKLSGK